VHPPGRLVPRHEPDKKLLLPNRVLAPTVSLDLTPYNGDEEASWTAMKTLGREAYLRTRDPISRTLQPSWSQQRASLHVCGATITGHDGKLGLRDLARHALHGAMKIADELKLPRVPIVTSGIGPDFADHGWGLKCEKDPSEVARVLEGRSSFVGADFRSQN
jgi:hypothetical protein